jgi:type I restriction enzyme S subunit
MVTAYTNGQVTLRSNRRLAGYHEAHDMSGHQGVEPGDLVVHGLDILRGSVGVSDARGAISSVCIVCSPVLQGDPRYTAYVIRAQAFSGLPRALARGIREGGADFRRWETLADLPIPLPPLAVQRAIADHLDTETARIDALIERKQRMVELLEERLQGAISEATHARSVADSAHRLPPNWNLMPLKRCLRSSVYGIGESSRAEGEYAVLGMTNVSSGEVVGAPGGFVSAVDDSLLLAPGDLLFNRTNSRELVGKVGLVRSLDGPTTFASYLVRLRVSRLADAQYLNYLLNTREVLGLARSMALPSIGQANLNPNRYSAMVLPIPPIEEQRRRISRLNALTSHTARMRQTLERQVSLLQEHRQALITAAVTGELEIAGVAT